MYLDTIIPELHQVVKLMRAGCLMRIVLGRHATHRERSKSGNYRSSNDTLETDGGWLADVSLLSAADVNLLTVGTCRMGLESRLAIGPVRGMATMGNTRRAAWACSGAGSAASQQRDRQGDGPIQ